MAKFAALAVCLLPGLLGAAITAEEFSVTRLDDNVFAIVRNDPPGFAVESNAGFVVCANQVVVIDAQSNDTTTSRVLAAIRRHTDKPVRYVINTHWHDDHIVGNRIYRDAFASVQFIAHREALSYLPIQGKKNRDDFHRAIPGAIESFRHTLHSGKPLSEEQRRSLESDIRLGEGYRSVPDDFVAILPDVPVQDRFAIREAGCAIDVLALGNAHTTGDLVVHLPKQSIVFTGDMLGWPVPLVGGEQSRVREWGATLTKVRDLHAAVIVPGHGPLMRDNEHLDRVITLMTTIAKRVDAAGGESLEAARKQIDLGDLKQQFSNGSDVNAALFDAYVTGPAITNAWQFR
jgi:glyoxylase-like metal-dependent hydrolase (beta-lactamase superfamily II)